MKNQKKYNVTIGVNYEKEVCIEAENSYDAIRSLKNILLKSDVFSYTPKEIYSLFMNATPTDDSIGKIARTLMLMACKTDIMMLT